MKREAGMSLLEVTVAMAIMGIVTLVAAELLTRISRESAGARYREGVQNDLQLLEGNLQKYMASGDIRFLAFTGSAPGTRAPEALSRLVIPQPGRCRDLSACGDQSALLYVHYDKTVTAAVSTFCELPPASAGQPYALLIDARDDTYGGVAFASGDFDVTTPKGAGVLRIQAGTPLALLDPPKAVLWYATGAPVLDTLVQDAAGIKDASGVYLPSECVGRLRDGVAPPAKLIDKVYRVRARPLVLTQFTGGAAADPADVDSNWGRFPLRLFGVTLRSLGAMPIPPPQGRYDAGYSDCTVSAVSGAVACASTAKVWFKPVDRVRVDEIFAVSLFGPAGSPAAATRFELLLDGMTVSSGCQAPGCARLPFAANGAVPALYGAGESYDRLSADGFSLIKQEALATLRVRLLMDANQGKEEAVDVRFP